MAEIETVSFQYLDHNLPESLIDRTAPWDVLEPEQSPEDQIRDARIAAISLITSCLSQVISALGESNATLTSVATVVWSWALALGLPCAEGMTVSRRAELLGVTRASLSKRMVEIVTVHSLPVSQFMKAEGSGDSYAEARRESIIRTNAKLNGELPTVPNAGRSV